MGLGAIEDWERRQVLRDTRQAWRDGYERSKVKDAGAHLMHRLMDTRRVTSEEESTTADPVELIRRSIEPEDIEAALSFYAPDAVWDASPWGMGVFEGQAAVRGFFEDWRSSYSDIERKAEEIRDLGNGVAFAVILQKGRVVGSSGSVQLRYASVMEWADGLIVRNTTYTDIDEARATAERLAEERG